MKILYDPHTHTSWSHGTATASEMIKKAHDMGLRGIHITEHGWNHHYARKMTRESYISLKTEIEENKKLYPDMDIKFGTEANIISLDGDIDFPDDMLGIFDVVNVGYHMLIKWKNIKSWWKLFVPCALSKKLHMKFLDKGLSQRTTDAMLKCLDRYHIDMITHPGRNYPIDIEKIAEKCIETGTLLEINGECGLMNEEMVNKIKDTDVKYIVGSDAHWPERIADVSRSFEIIDKTGLDPKKVVNLTID
mgnify:CR=1 FL=1